MPLAANERQQGLEGALRAVEGRCGVSGQQGVRWKVRAPLKKPAANPWKVNSGNR